MQTSSLPCGQGQIHPGVEYGYGIRVFCCVLVAQNECWSFSVQEYPQDTLPITSLDGRQQAALKRAEMGFTYKMHVHACIHTFCPTIVFGQTGFEAL